MVLPSEELARLLEIVKSHPEGITTRGVVDEHFGFLPDYKVPSYRSKTFAKLRYLEKCGQIKCVNRTKQGNTWVPNPIKS